MTKRQVIDIRTTALQQFQDQLKAFGVKGAKLKDLSAGFEGGMTAMFVYLRQQGHVTLEDAAE